MRAQRSISSLAIIDMAIGNAKYNTRKSEINRKWIRYLKNRKLFDEYMVYLGNNNAAGAEPKTYRQLSNVCHNLSKTVYHVEGLHIQVNWVEEFKKFAWKSIKWYDVKNMFLYVINNGYT